MINKHLLGATLAGILSMAIAPIANAEPAKPSNPGTAYTAPYGAEVNCGTQDFSVHDVRGNRRHAGYFGKHGEDPLLHCAEKTEVGHGGKSCPVLKHRT